MDTDVALYQKLLNIVHQNTTIIDSASISSTDALEEIKQKQLYIHGNYKTWNIFCKLENIDEKMLNKLASHARMKKRDNKRTWILNILQPIMQQHNKPPPNFNMLDLLGTGVEIETEHGKEQIILKYKEALENQKKAVSNLITNNKKRELQMQKSPRTTHLNVVAKKQKLPATNGMYFCYESM